MFLTCQLCAGQEADSTGLPQKPVFIDVQLNGELNWEHQNYSDQTFRFTLTTHNAKNVWMSYCFEVSYPDKTPLRPWNYWDYQTHVFIMTPLSSRDTGTMEKHTPFGLAMTTGG